MILSKYGLPEPGQRLAERTVMWAPVVAIASFHADDRHHSLRFMHQFAVVNGLVIVQVVNQTSEIMELLEECRFY